MAPGVNPELMGGPLGHGEYAFAPGTQSTNPPLKLRCLLPNESDLRGTS